MVQHAKAGPAMPASGDAPQLRNEDPLEGRLSIRKWYDISSRLPGQLAPKSVNGLDTRRFIEAVLWVAMTDSTWPQLPKSYGNFHIVYQRFARWTKLDVWDFVCTRLQGDPRLPVLQHLVSQERDIQLRRDSRAAQVQLKAMDATAESTQRLHALEARVDMLEALLRGKLVAAPDANNPA